MPKKLPAKVKEVWESKLKQSPSKNKHISYSQLVNYTTCPKKWHWQYVKKLIPYTPSIHTAFGTAMHETIQTWLEVLYYDKVKTAEEMDLHSLLYENMMKTYRVEKAKNGHQHFSNADELQLFYLDGIHILDYIKKKRRVYFSTKGTYLAGVETLLYQELRPGVKFKGFIDLVFYNEILDQWTVVDIKTSTSGWNKYAKADDKKKAQVLLYKKFFSEQFDIPIEKITVEYFIVKRKIPVEADFASMQKRVQEFRPSEGPRKMKQAVQMMEKFVKETITDDGNFIEKDFLPTPSIDSCKFCELKKMRICPDAVF